MKDATRRHVTRATAEMTIIRADKIAFDERALPFAPARRARLIIPRSLTRTHFAAAAAAAREKIDRTGNAAGPETRRG